MMKVIFILVLVLSLSIVNAQNSEDWRSLDSLESRMDHIEFLNELFRKDQSLCNSEKECDLMLDYGYRSKEHLVFLNEVRSIRDSLWNLAIAYVDQFGFPVDTLNNSSIRIPDTTILRELGIEVQEEGQDLSINSPISIDSILKNKPYLLDSSQVLQSFMNQRNSNMAFYAIPTVLQNCSANLNQKKKAFDILFDVYLEGHYGTYGLVGLLNGAHGMMYGESYYPKEYKGEEDHLFELIQRLNWDIPD